MPSTQRTAELGDDMILVTGGYGCIGAETTKYLLRHTQANVLICSRSASDARSSEVFGELTDAQRQRLQAESLNIQDKQAVQQLLLERPINRVVHLAALQTPDCNAHRDLGLQVNLAGTQHLLEACKAAIESGRDFKRFVFASSIAVYGFRKDYPPGEVDMHAAARPVNPYGVWKLAGEELTRQFHEETGVPTLSLRPGVLFGPGRDIGLTSSPTTAMKKLAVGEAYEIPFQSRQDYLYAPDVGACFAATAIEPFEGNGVYTLPSVTTDTQGFVEQLRQTAADLKLAHPFEITVGGDEVPFICDLDFAPFVNEFPDVPHTSLADALRESMQYFCRQA